MDVNQCKSKFSVRYYYLAIPAAENELALLVTTLDRIDREILQGHRFRESLPRSDLNRPLLYSALANLRSERWATSHQKSDLDQAITHLTEAVLLSQTQYIDSLFFYLATHLLLRFTHYRQPDDIKSSIKYFRFLRINLPSLETFDSIMGDLLSNTFHALALGLEVTPGEAVQGLEEMVAILPKLVTSDILTFPQKNAIKAFRDAATAEMFCQEDTRPIADRAIQVLREAAVLNPDLEIAFTLAICLTYRFETMFVMNDCDEAIAILDRVIATCRPGKDLTVMESNAIRLISGLLLSRANLSPTPENLERSIHCLRTFVSYSLDDEVRTQLTLMLSGFTHKRFEYFGLTGNSGGTPPDPSLRLQPRSHFVGRGDSRESDSMSQTQEKIYFLHNSAVAIVNGETKDVEAAVEASRKLIPLQQSSDKWSRSTNLTEMFAGVLMHAYRRTERLDFLNEAITTFQNLHKISATSKLTHFDVGRQLHDSLKARLRLLHHPQDLDKFIQLSSELANDGSGEVFTRFKTSCFWATEARVSRHRSASIAYEMAMSLLQETLVFCPTLQTQHHRLADAEGKGGRFTSDYASYRIENGQVEQAIETLERGRALIWSEMRGLRTSTDQLRAADLALADKFSDINQRLESVTMSVAQSDEDEIIGGTGQSISHLVVAQRRLLEERDTLISHIQSLPGFENFLKPLSFEVLNSAAACGPVIIINLARPKFPSSIIILLKDSHPSVISTPSDFYDRANRLKSELLRVRKKQPEGPSSVEYDHTLAYVLAELYELVGKSVVKELRRLEVPEKSRVWWCPTEAFCSLPLHAMGPILSDDDNVMYFSDLYIPSYTPTLAALIESRKLTSLSDASDNLKPSILLVAQPETLPGVFGEIEAIEATKTPVKSLISAMATPETVIKGLKDHRFAHFACHGNLKPGKPFDSSLELHGDNLTLLTIVRSQLPAAELAFLSACHTAELTEDSIDDEGLHLAAAMQYCGFRSVVGTMWAMADVDGEDLSKRFYKTIFSDKADQNGVLYHERSARALQNAVNKLRKKKSITLERWVNFVHYGA